MARSICQVAAQTCDSRLRRPTICSSAASLRLAAHGLGRHRDLGRIGNILAVEAAQAEARPATGHAGAASACAPPRAATGDLDGVVGLGVGRGQQAASSCAAPAAAGKRLVPTTKTAARTLGPPWPRARQGPDHGRTPQRRRGVEAVHVDALAQDDARAQEADAGHDLGGDAGRIACRRPGRRRPRSPPRPAPPARWCAGPPSSGATAARSRWPSPAAAQAPRRRADRPVPQDRSACLHDRAGCHLPTVRVQAGLSRLKTPAHLVIGEDLAEAAPRRGRPQRLLGEAARTCGPRARRGSGWPGARCVPRSSRTRLMWPASGT